MPNTEFCCKSGGSNLNAGTRSGTSTEPGVAADFTYASGSWVAATGVFTVAAGNPATDGVAAGDFVSVYADGSTVTGFVGRVTAVTATTITVSLTAKSGTAPADGTGTRTLKVGGAWQGPNAAVAFPFGFAAGTMTNTSSHIPRVNFKNTAVYAITAAMSHTAVGSSVWQGYSTVYADAGLATFNGGSTGASYVLLSITGSGYTLENLEFVGNGATGAARGMVLVANRATVRRVVMRDIRGAGFQDGSLYIECEAYNCNLSNTFKEGGWYSQGAVVCIRCISRNNPGTNSNGFWTNQNGTYINCIAANNGAKGFWAEGLSQVLQGCDSYNNVGVGIEAGGATSVTYIMNCNLVKNGGAGISASGGTCMVYNCGFGAGTQVNGGGQTSGSQIATFGTFAYAANITPWVNPVTGDFRLNVAEAKGTGRGAFLNNDAGFTGTISYPDIGAAQHLETAAGAGSIFGGSVIR